MTPTANIRLPRLDRARLDAARVKARADLLSCRNEAGHWTGHLSSSALSTATAIVALTISTRAGVLPDASACRVRRGCDWLLRHQNADGGWGDSVLSRSNLSTTTLCWAALGRPVDSEVAEAVSRAETWMSRRIRIDPAALRSSLPTLVQAIIDRYGTDHTFSVPILTACALSGRLGPEPEAWNRVVQLPFELAALPRAWFATLQLPVVSYALPALIAMGCARHVHRPARNPILRALRRVVAPRTLRVLREIQPLTGGFLEATPLTSFVIMSLAGSGLADHPVVRNGLDFLGREQRDDGSWPIDTNLATWVTTLSVNALGSLSSKGPLVPEADRVTRWLLRQQCRETHPYTMAAPGGWAWTDLPGGVPDADDTAGALVALALLAPVPDAELLRAAGDGTRWLARLQNRDGGIPTFCRGWGTQPFDRSSEDITAHALRAWAAWWTKIPQTRQPALLRAIHRAIVFLLRRQSPAGSWRPLWFGNERAPEEANPVYGTSRVLLAMADLLEHPTTASDQVRRAADAGASWLVSVQNPDGSWGGDRSVPGSVEETALALEALACGRDVGQGWEQAIENGAGWLLDRVNSGEWKRPSPVGFYFAKLWYFEDLYPRIFTVAALERLSVLAGELPPEAPA